MDLTKWLVSLGIAVTMTAAAMAYFVPTVVFNKFLDQYSYDRAIQTRRELRREVSDCQTLMKERIEFQEPLTPLESERCNEALDEYDSVRKTINDRWVK